MILKEKRSIWICWMNVMWIHWVLFAPTPKPIWYTFWPSLSHILLYALSHTDPYPWMRFLVSFLVLLLSLLGHMITTFLTRKGLCWVAITLHHSHHMNYWFFYKNIIKEWRFYYYLLTYNFSISYTVQGLWLFCQSKIRNLSMDLISYIS